MNPKIQTGIRIPPRLLAWLQRQAEAEECSLSEMIRTILQRAHAEAQAQERRFVRDYSQDATANPRR